MEEEKQTCTRCRTTREISHFQITGGKLRKTCAKCREGQSKKRRSNVNFEELGRAALKQKIKDFLENNARDIRLECLIKAEEFEGNKHEYIAKSVARFIQDCDGYVYKYMTVYVALNDVHNSNIPFLLVFILNIHQLQVKMLLLFVFTAVNLKSY